MTNQEAVNILLNERKCIDRNDGTQCDRKCESCDLVMDAEQIRETYSMAISAIKARDAHDINVDTISRQAALDCFHDWIDRHGDVHTPDEMAEYRAIEELPSAQPYTEADIQKMQDLEQAELQKAYECGRASAQPEWNNHTVACLLAELFDDTCACNYNGIDEWLPEKCEVIDACPNPVGVACWEQFLKHRAERRTDG